jgi:apolipoprotein N-acyltransferase
MKTQWIQIGTAVVLLAGTLGYGAWRRSGPDFPAGPRVAAIQGNFPTTVKNDHDPRQIYAQHLSLSGLATRKQPDLIVWPEGMFPWPYFAPPKDLTQADLKERFPHFAANWNDQSVVLALNGIAQKSGAAVLIGCQTVTADPQGLQFYNSAAFVTPEQGIVSRYDKLHRVPFGEYIPLKDLVSGLQYFTPYRGEFGIQAGASPVFMEHKGFRYAPVICFEDTVPQLVRSIVLDSTKAHPKRQELDLLLNLSNDGWFHGSSELDQHLITAAFRSVECRVPMVRAVNTGISAVIDGDGAIRARAVNEKTGQFKETEAYLVESVPLDPRESLYVRYGDWFAAVCLGITLLAAALGLFRYARNDFRGVSPSILPTKPAEQLA